MTVIEAGAVIRTPRRCLRACAKERYGPEQGRYTEGAHECLQGRSCSAITISTATNLAIRSTTRRHRRDDAKSGVWFVDRLDGLGNRDRQRVLAVGSGGHQPGA